jgi:multidrug resistance protein EbrA
MTYVLLGIAILFEAFGSAMLKVTSMTKNYGPYIGVAVGYATAFYFLSLTLKELEIGVAYAIWSGVGTALAATIGVVIFKEGFDRKKLIGIAIIILGVVLLNLSK